MALTKQFIEMQEAYERKIADLETKLDEKTRVVEGYSELFDKKQHENYQQFCEIQELKKQLEYIAKNKYEERLSAYERKVNQLKQELAKERKKVVQEVWEDFERCFESNNLKWEDKMLVGKVCNMINEILDQAREASDG